MSQVTRREAVITCVSAWITDQDGVLRRHLEGEQVTVTDEDFTRLAAYGHIRGLDEDVFEDTDDVPPPPEEDEPRKGRKRRKRPTKTAPVAAWRAYAKELGIQVTGMTRFELIQAVSKVEG